MKNPGSYAYRADNAMEYDEDFEEDDENPDQGFNQNGYFGNYDDSKRHPKKRKLESFVAKNEFTSRREIWSEEEIALLLDVWGERYMELGRRSLRADDWADVTEKVAEMSGVERSEVECRNQLDVLKNKYKKERAKMESGQESKWMFFKKMDVMLNLRARPPAGLGCGIDSGEYVFMNPRVYLDRSNVMDEMRDSPGQSDEEDEDDGDDGLGGEEEVDGESARLLADSIQRFGEIYEKIEENKRNQMLELEKMRQDFQRDLEMQKKQIVDRAQAEIAKLRDMDDEEDNTDSSSENLGD
ncbi:trihelix transcription factor ASIL2 [Andrographis paniculata]|uniref:trihelix transcription factor ASIL2 n=1 Tax=Andrographis paniculata TaxID=175694 RepID=UPI0021E7C518|nr:trihelix transcription factor ASIL2 [Andrographis paniculata]